MPRCSSIQAVVLVVFKLDRAVTSADRAEVNAWPVEAAALADPLEVLPSGVRIDQTAYRLACLR